MNTLKLIDKLTTPGALSGFLNLALDGIDRLRANGQFSHSKSVEGTTGYYLRASDALVKIALDFTWFLFITAMISMMKIITLIMSMKRAAVLHSKWAQLLIVN